MYFVILLLSKKPAKCESVYFINVRHLSNRRTTNEISISLSPLDTKKSTAAAEGSNYRDIRVCFRSKQPLSRHL